MCVRCGTGTVAWCTDPGRHGDGASVTVSVVCASGYCSQVDECPVTGCACECHKRAEVISCGREQAGIILDGDRTTAELVEAAWELAAVFRELHGKAGK